MNLLNQNNNQDPAIHQLSKSFDASKGYQSAPRDGSYNQFAKKNVLNVSNLKRQEMMSSQLSNTNHYEKFINKKIDETFQPKTSNSEFMQSNNFTHKELKQKFLAGQEDRYCFNAEKDIQNRDNTTDVNVHTLDLDHIPANLTVDDIKRTLGAKHLVSLEVDTDNVKNINTGKGKISIRSNTKDEKEALQQILYDLGIESSDFQQKNRKKTARVGTSAVGFLDSRNEIDLNKGKRDRHDDYVTTQSKSQSRVKPKKNVTSKVGQNMFIRPQEYFKQYQNETKSTRTKFYESAADLFGNTNGAYSQAHNERLARELSTFDANEKQNKSEHKLINDWMKMQKRFDKYASNRALQPTISRYGKNHKY